MNLNAIHTHTTLNFDSKKNILSLSEKIFTLYHNHLQSYLLYISTLYQQPYILSLLSHHISTKKVDSVSCRTTLHLRFLTLLRQNSVGFRACDCSTFFVYSDAFSSRVARKVAECEQPKTRFNNGRYHILM